MTKQEKQTSFFSALIPSHSNYTSSQIENLRGRKIVIESSRAGRTKLGVNALSERNNRAKELRITCSSKECVVSRRAELAGSLQAGLFFDEPRPCSV